MFGNWKKSSYKSKVYVFSHFNPSGLTCELTVMSLGRVLRRDKVVSELYVYDLDGNLLLMGIVK